MILTVFTPVNSAAMRLPPVARTCRPKRVLASTTAPRVTANAIQTSRPGIGPKFPPPKTRLYVSFRIGCGAESVMR